MDKSRSENIKQGWLTGRQQIGAYTGWSKRTVSRMLDKIPHKRLGHKLVMVKVVDLDRALESL